ncbi:MAG: 2-vinyl bacteriochlorophyllide hydratase [Anaerolineae bacterium]|jgi:3-vinyl bacteriochlorophyllide hydratase|nr:2-vinyl bacteriochlorophyllide hydratase [Anaerolineae bacterium]
MSATGYTAQQLERRNKSPWTLVQAVLAPTQLLAFLVSVGLIVRYLSTGEGYQIATASVIIKIALMWLITITGMFWEKEVYGRWFLAPEFFWEDAVNAAALVIHNLYFIALLLGWSEHDLMVLMLVAYTSYLVNFAQFFRRGLQARQKRLAAAAAVGK